MNLNKQNIASFDKISKDQWLERIKKELRGRDYQEIQWEIEDGILLDPLYTAEDADDMWTAPDIRQGWEIADCFELRDEEEGMNEAILRSLQGGAQCLILRSGHSDRKNLPALLEGVRTDAIRLILECAPENDPAGWVETAAALSPGGDAPGAYCRFTGTAAQWKSIRDGISPENRDRFARSIAIDAATVDSGLLAEVLRELIATLDELDKNDLTTYARTTLLWESSPDYLRDTIYLRALHKLIAVLSAEYKIAERPEIEARIATRKETDPFRQMIHCACMAQTAAAGGADRICIPPLSPIENADEDTSRRIARNIQHILQLESHFDKVADPVLGSYYFEVASERIAEKSWGKLKIEN